jgi:hypothetical protein
MRSPDTDPSRGPQIVRGDRGATRAYLSVCAIYRDDAEYLREWIEFHRVVGVERFFLYNNLSEDDHRTVLHDYIEEGVVILHDWPKPFFPIGQGMMKAYEHCLEEYGATSRWIAFIDIDEFLFSPTGRPLPELLIDYERWPAVLVNWAMFGTSGHRTKPSGLVIESYVRRTRHTMHNAHFKSIVDPSRVESPRNPHAFRYRDGEAVNENGDPPALKSPGMTESVSFSKFRINHYWSKSQEECRKKFDLWAKAGGAEAGQPRPWAFFEARDKRLNEQSDDTILMYLPSLWERLEPMTFQGRDEAVAGATARRSLVTTS